MRPRELLVLFSPLAPALGGFALSIWRFRADDSFGGVALGLVGLLVMMIVAARLPGPPQA